MIGIDIGAYRLHCVAVDQLSGYEVAVFAADELDQLSAWAQQAVMIAIDAPAQLSREPHAADDGLSPKFRRARCAEIALGREHGIWVPWVAPLGPPISGWMEVGFELYRRLGAQTQATLLEVYPYGAFFKLAGQRPAKKASVAGARQRVELLADAGLEPTGIAMWSHDGLDALASALVARDHHAGRAVRVGCGHDESAIWLPAASGSDQFRTGYGAR